MLSDYINISIYKVQDFESKPKHLASATICFASERQCKDFQDELQDLLSNINKLFREDNKKRKPSRIIFDSILEFSAKYSFDFSAIVENETSSQIFYDTESDLHFSHLFLKEFLMSLKFEKAQIVINDNKKYIIKSGYTFGKKFKTPKEVIQSVKKVKQIREACQVAFAEDEEDSAVTIHKIKASSEKEKSSEGDVPSEGKELSRIDASTKNAEPTKINEDF